LVFSLEFFLGFYSKLLPPHNITVMRKQTGTPKVHVNWSRPTEVWRLRVFAVWSGRRWEGRGWA